MGARKGNKIRLTVELPASVNITEAKENLVAKTEGLFEEVISLRADISEIIIEALKEEK